MVLGISRLVGRGAMGPALHHVVVGGQGFGKNFRVGPLDLPFWLCINPRYMMFLKLLIALSASGKQS
jgi:hypothetical protein